MHKILHFFRLLFTFLVVPYYAAAASNKIELVSNEWVYTITPATLQVIAVQKGTAQEVMLSAGLAPAAIKIVAQDGAHARVADLTRKLIIDIALDQHGINFKIKALVPQTLAWPITGTADKVQAFIVPSGAGLYIPKNDVFWQQQLQQYQPEFSMPFWGVQYATRSVSYISDDCAQTQYLLHDSITAQHTFLARNIAQEYTVSMHIVAHDVLAAAFDYRDWLEHHEPFVTLRDKIAINPNVAKLLGAFHVWVFNDGKSRQFLDVLHSLQIKHLWIGYDKTVAPDFNIDAAYIARAVQQGYLIGPYDSYVNAQAAKTADSITSQWGNNLWPAGCVRTDKLKFLTGFNGRGCYLSSEALRVREPTEHNLDARVQLMTKDGDNSYFLDCDSATPLYEDFSVAHPMTAQQDLRNRLERMAWLSNNKKLVVGSENGLSFAHNVIAYNNGGFAVFLEKFWPILRDKKQFGGWWPSNRPNVLFKPYHAPADFVRANYSAQYRIPLYQAVFHDAIISTDRWELSEFKLPNILAQKILLESLYNVPAIFVLDIHTLQQHNQLFATYAHFFSEVHQAIGLERLTAFAWLTPDHLVQQTKFGDKLTMTANFSAQPYHAIPAGCVQATWLATQVKKTYCPHAQSAV